MRKILAALGVLAILLLQACSRQATSIPDRTAPASGASTAKTPSPQPDPIIAEVMNASYQLGLSDQVQVVQLSGGRFQHGERNDPDFFSVSVTEHIAVGDLDEDGSVEAAALIAENYGGTGSFVLLTVFKEQAGNLEYLTSVYVDDRPIIQSMTIEGGQVRVEAIVHDFDDPNCCPSLATNRVYRLYGTNLTLRELSTYTPAGQPRTITLETPTEGAEVSGIVQIAGRISIAPFENNLVYRLFDMGGVELSAGPITVEAEELGAPGTFQKAIDLGDILTNTTVRIEVQDVNVAGGPLFAMDSVMVQVR